MRRSIYKLASIFLGLIFAQACDNNASFAGKTKVIKSAAKRSDAEAGPESVASKRGEPSPESVQQGACQGSRNIALITQYPLDAAASNLGGMKVMPLQFSAVEANPALIAAHDTIAVELGSNAGGDYELPSYIRARLDSGAKVLVLWNNEIQNVAFRKWGISAAHFHSGTTVDNPRVTFDKKGEGIIFDAFDPNSIGPRNLLQMYSMGGDGKIPGVGRIPYPGAPTSEEETLCGTFTYDDFAQGGNKGAFHGYLPDTATRKGILYLVGVNYIKTEGGKSVVDLGEKFIKAHFQQTWDATAELSETCGLKCDAMEPAMEQSVGKPVVYLYPKKEQKISVKVELKDGRFVTTFPKYDEQKKGWDVVAKPDGTLKNLADNQEYSYIYWTGASKAFKPDLSEGFLVKGEDTASFLRKALAGFGMTPREYNEMIVYWLPHMERHSYNVIKFLAKEYTDVASMEITPKPDSLLRVFMVFKESDGKSVVKEQKLPAPFKRQGFAVVEWGGAEIDGEWSVFK